MLGYGFLSVDLELSDHSVKLLTSWYMLSTQYLSSKQDVVREHHWVRKFRSSHYRLSLGDRINFDFEGLADHLTHADIVALVYHCDDEIHEYHVSDEYVGEPSYPH